MSAVTITRLGPFGDHSLLATVGSDAEARRLAAAVRLALPEAVEVIPALETVLISLAPGQASAAVEARIHAAAATAAAEVAGKTVVLPVTYDGEDLAEVATLLDMSVEQVVARHTAATYTVAALGFAPGFPYLNGLDPALTVPRLDTPRTRVPAGSVGLAAGQTCVYPSDSPGGWRLIGRTSTVLFDAALPQPALLTPGDTVRFEAVR